MKKKHLLLISILLITLWSSYLVSCKLLAGDGVGVDGNGNCSDIHDPAGACFCNPTIVGGDCYDSCMIAVLTSVVDSASGDTVSTTSYETDETREGCGSMECDPTDPNGKCYNACKDISDCKDNPDCVRTVDYETQIAQPILRSSNCISCHNGATGTGVTTTGVTAGAIDGLWFNPIPPIAGLKKELERLVNHKTGGTEFANDHPILRVHPYEPDSSYLYVILFKDKDGKTDMNSRMPQDLPALSDAETGIIKKWICEGACESLDSCNIGR